ncbi:DUF1761 domain-containing protein [Cognatiyoonia sp. IB215182]|uniref:DUF1761 domain-containing protein n=1 Tax=Cognatiyoonia sp. IB215182 TaxID=3097353 RepID=UPI002A1634AF|nr:DUF1761 domain-containing protein [Cognatiyoonia sp. IB215182]MDX8353007.1 DUF1761 domain-containing protein [Cognatiyoonia sp. IB215182]
MEILSVLVAAFAAFVFGAVYYMVLSKPWMEAAQIAVGDDGKPVNSSNPTPYIVSFICIILVAGMMRHTLALSGIDTISKGVQSGLGIGLFFITPWIFINTGYSDRPWKLAVIDGGYATLAAAIIGGVLIAL